MLSDTPGATINYTTDGSTPSQSHGTLYSVPLDITSTTTLQAIAYETGLTTSGVASGSYTINPGSTITQINCGGLVASPFTPDTDYSGGATYGTSLSHHGDRCRQCGADGSLPKLSRAAPAAYTVPNITPGATCTVRLHFAESSCTGAGQRQFNVLINNVPVLTNFDIFATAGAEYQAVVQTFTAGSCREWDGHDCADQRQRGRPLICGHRGAGEYQHRRGSLLHPGAGCV